MSRILIIGKFFRHWLFVYGFLLTLGVVAGFLILFLVFPGKPKVGIIEIPSTRITADSAFVIGEMLDYARRTDSIKAVVIKLDSPGGGVTASEDLFFKTLRLREEKPVVISVGGIAASGAYLMSMGANYIYAKPSSIVGSVGVVLTLPRSQPPSERVITTGPFKRTGASERTFIGIAEELKEAFLKTVLTFRRDRLQITPEELAEARIYTGMEALRLGLVDALGTDVDAVRKAADLAGISHYGRVDINDAVLPLFVERLRRLVAAPESDEIPIDALDISQLRRALLLLDENGSSAGLPPDFPIDTSLPQFFYLYIVPSE